MFECNTAPDFPHPCLERMNLVAPRKATKSAMRRRRRTITIRALFVVVWSGHGSRCLSDVQEEADEKADSTVAPQDLREFVNGGQGLQPEAVRKIR